MNKTYSYLVYIFEESQDFLVSSVHFAWVHGVKKVYVVYK